MLYSTWHVSEGSDRLVTLFFLFSEARPAGARSAECPMPGALEATTRAPAGRAAQPQAESSLDCLTEQTDQMTPLRFQQGLQREPRAEPGFKDMVITLGHRNILGAGGCWSFGLGTSRRIYFLFFSLLCAFFPFFLSLSFLFFSLHLCFVVFFSPLLTPKGKLFSVTLTETLL